MKILNEECNNQNGLNQSNSISIDIPKSPSKKFKRKLENLRFPIFSVIIVLSGALVQHFILSLYQENSGEQTAYIYLSWFLLFMTLLSYFRIAMTDHTQTAIEEKTKGNSKKSFNYSNKDFSTKCEFCNRLKFERSSHCTNCGVCVTRRDHHCLWINKCVGYSNTQYFINYCVWIWLTGLNILSGFIKFYNKEEDNTKEIISIYTKVFLYLYTVMIVVGTIGITSIIIEQINSIYNEVTYNERRKKPHHETFYLCCVPKNLEGKETFGYNKGFLNNLHNIIGPTIFHFFVPLSKYNTQDIPESEKVFARMKTPHAVEIWKHVKTAQPQLYEDYLKQDDKGQDPHTFLEFARSRYQNVYII